MIGPIDEDGFVACSNHLPKRRLQFVVTSMNSKWDLFGEFYYTIQSEVSYEKYHISQAY